MSISPLRIGQEIRGRLGLYTITTLIHEGVWFGKNQRNEFVVIKSVLNHPRVEHEREVLKRFQNRSTAIRPYIDEIQVPAEPATIVLSHAQSDLREASLKKRLTRAEVKYVAGRVLEALQVLHEDGYVHADIKLENIFVNEKGSGSTRFTDAQLGDFGSACPQDHPLAREGKIVGSPLWLSPEMILEEPWNTSTDIWSFGSVLISLLFGKNFNIFRPEPDSDDEAEYITDVLEAQWRCFGPFHHTISEIYRADTQVVIMHLTQIIPANTLTPFRKVSETQVHPEDRAFICKIMQLDWRKRPTAKQLLEDEWFRT